jgi:hypothetical protein
MHQGNLIDELIESVERAEEHALATMELHEPTSGTVYELPRAEALIGVA